MWTDVYLRAADAATARSVLTGLPLLAGEAWVPAGTGWALDVIGPVVVTPAVLGDEGEDGERPVLALPVIDSRWHANLRLRPDLVIAWADLLAPLLIDPPSAPRRGWA